MDCHGHVHREGVTTDGKKKQTPQSSPWASSRATPCAVSFVKGTTFWYCGATGSFSFSVSHEDGTVRYQCTSRAPCIPSPVKDARANDRSGRRALWPSVWALNTGLLRLHCTRRMMPIPLSERRRGRTRHLGGSPHTNSSGADPCPLHKSPTLSNMCPRIAPEAFGLVGTYRGRKTNAAAGAGTAGPSALELEGYAAVF